ncbi:MAG: hypothetical protein IPG86_11070 [Chitinophagaceae bacterium]|nr:hypothetical protein [Chitinophagaceae bacterium]
MKRAKKIYNLVHLLSAVGMILSLLWLTVSTPVVYAAQQKLEKYKQLEKAGAFPETEEDTTNPFGNNTEEKAPSGTNLSEEYLHDHHVQFHFSPGLSLLMVLPRMIPIMHFTANY